MSVCMKTTQFVTHRYQDSIKHQERITRGSLHKIAEGLQNVFAEWQEKESADVLLGRTVADRTAYTAAEGRVHILPVWESACIFIVLMETMIQQYLYLIWHQTKRKLILELFCAVCMQPTQQDMDINVCNPDTDVFSCFARYITDCLWTLKLVLTDTC